MASKWRQLAPHFLVMLAIYAVFVIALASQGIQSFWISLGIALAIALFYPAFARAFDIAPEPWQRD